MKSAKSLAKVCFVAPKAYPLFNPACKEVFGGAEVDLYLLATELAKDKNFAVSFIVADYGQAETERIEDVTIIKSIDVAGNQLHGAMKIWGALQKADADIYIQKTASWGTFLVALFCKLKRRAFVYRTASQLECDGTYMKQPFFAGRAFRWSLRKASRVLAQNQADREGLKRTMGLDSIVIPNAHRLETIGDAPRDIILWVGRSALVKRPELFFKLARQFPQERFVIICQRATGDDRYEQLIDEAGKVANLEFIERVPFSEIAGYFARAKVFVNTSDSEGFPNTFIQACSAGVPIVSLNVNPDGFLERHNCGKACGGDLAKCVDVLQYMFAENRYGELGKNARAYAEANHDITKIAAEYKKLFKDILRSERRSECAE